jgi:UDP-GlcNAc:undecaprenyl-phosphate GlcNAc-1-phosphate transferase
MALGFSHWNCVLIIYGISASFGLVAVFMTFLNSPKATLILSCLLLLVVLGADKIGMFSGEKAKVQVHNAKHHISG